MTKRFARRGQRRMRALASLTVLATVSVLLGCLVVGVVPASAAPAAWGVVSSPSPGDSENQLHDVSCPNIDRCYAVGYQLTAGQYHPLIETWDGTSWSAMASPALGTAHGFLDAVSCVDATGCVAVGWSQNPPSLASTLIETWDGTSWSVTSSPSPGSLENVLLGVSCPSTGHCYAGGYARYGTYDTETLTESWDGTAWTVDPSPNASTDFNELQSVSCTTTTDCVAVGTSFSPADGYATLIESWDGTSWSVTPSPDAGATTNGAFLNGVTCVSATFCLAVGEHNSGGTLVETWDGTTWAIAPSPDPAPGSDDPLTAVSCVSATDCVAVGYYSTGSSTVRTFAETWNGVGWSVTPTSSPGLGQNLLYGVSCVTTTTCAATGTYNNGGTLAERTLIESAGSVSGPVPTAPRAPTAVPGNGTATLHWTAPTSNGGSPISGYVVTPYLAGVAQTPRTFNSTATTRSVSALTNGKSYAFRIAAKNAGGVGPRSAATSAVTVGAPTAPILFKAAVPGNGSATLSWRAPSSTNGSAITGYVITPYLGSTPQPAQTFAATATTGVLVGLTNGKTYTLGVAAKNARGMGPKAYFVGVLVGAPTAPTILSVTPGPARVTLHWTTPNSNGAAITAYIVTPYFAGVALTPRVFTSTATTQTVTGLTSGQTYTFTVAAKNARGTGPPSVASSAATPT